MDIKDLEKLYIEHSASLALNVAAVGNFTAQKDHNSFGVKSYPRPLTLKQSYKEATHEYYELDSAGVKKGASAAYTRWRQLKDWMEDKTPFGMHRRSLTKAAEQFVIGEITAKRQFEYYHTPLVIKGQKGYLLRESAISLFPEQIQSKFSDLKLRFKSSLCIFGSIMCIPDEYYRIKKYVDTRQESFL